MTTHKLTPFGEVIRYLQKKLGLRLCDISEVVACSASYLSGSTYGHKSIPSDYIYKIINAYNLKGNDANKLIKAYTLTRNHVLIDHLDLKEKELVATFAYIISFMSYGEKERLNISMNNIAESCKGFLKKGK